MNSDKLKTRNRSKKDGGISAAILYPFVVYLIEAHHSV